MKTTTKTPAVKTATAAYLATARMATNEYGILEPTLDLAFPAGTHYRMVSASLHRMAAQAEEASCPSTGPVGANEGWIVRIEDRGRDKGRVFLELGDGTPAEAARGLAMLERIAATKA